MPNGIPKNGINKGWFKKGHLSIYKHYPYQGFQKGHPDFAKERRKELGLKPPSQKGLKRNKETIIKLRESHKGIRQSEKTKKKRSKLMMGNKNALGYKLTDKQLKNRKGIIPWNKNKKSLQSKEHHWNWQGGINPENDTIRKSIDSRLWREAVFARDNWTCQKYGIKGGKLMAHHIQNFAQYPELRFAIDNGITLSDKAHREFHKIYGFKKNTRTQLEEFLVKNSISEHYDKRTNLKTSHF